MRGFIFLLIFSLVFLLIAKTTLAVLTINEINPVADGSDTEWVEIYNDENSNVDLTQYFLIDKVNKEIKWSENNIPGLNYAIATSNNVLNNDGDTVILKNNLDEVVDIATYSGTITSAQVYARCPNTSGEWTLLNIKTKHDSNFGACPTPSPVPTPTTAITITITPSPTEQITITPVPSVTESPALSPTTNFTTYDNIFISELMAYPGTNQHEWVEIFNNNDFAVTLTNWYLDDIENGGSSPKIFSLAVPAHVYGVINLTSSMFNNTGDNVRLLDFAHVLKDSFEYQETSQNKTLGRTDFNSDSYCEQEPTQGKPNNACLTAPTPTAAPTTKPTPTPKKSPTPTPTKSVALSSINQLSSIQSNNSPTVYRKIINTTSDNEAVLGAATSGKNNNQTQARALSFTSFGYSLLTIISFLFKMKTA